MDIVEILLNVESNIYEDQNMFCAFSSYKQREEIISWCIKKKKLGWNDDKILPCLLQGLLNKQHKITSNEFFWQKMPIKSNSDSVKTYLMIDNRNGYIKIGKSKKPNYREKTLQSEIPNIKLLCYIDSDIEKELHSMFRDKHIRGEWFNLSKKDIKIITKDNNWVWDKLDQKDLYL